MADIVIDTNVLMHADDPRLGKYRETSIQLQKAMRGDIRDLCVDEGFHTDPNKNRSLIATEYFANLQPGTTGHTTLMFLAQEERIKIVGTKVEPSAARRLRRIRTRRDRTFVRVALNSDDRLFVSHDFQDFPKIRRRELQATLGISIKTAAEAIDE